MVGHTDVEIIKLRGLHQAPLHYLSEGGNTIAHQGILKDVKIGIYRGGMHAAILGDIVVVDNLAVSQGRHFQKALESIV